jgi:hypothetical protein
MDEEGMSLRVPGDSQWHERRLMEEVCGLPLLFEKKQKVMFIFLAQEKGTKRTSTLPSLPYMGGCN